MVARNSTTLTAMVHRKPYRDDFVYLLAPWSVVKDSAERMSRHAIELAGSNGLIVVEDSMASFALRYVAVVEGRDGVEVNIAVDLVRMAEAFGAGRPVVLVPRDRDKPITTPALGSLWKRTGDLYYLQPVERR
jgi:hypothetical protein